MNKEIKALWTTALRSEDYVQGDGYLRYKEGGQEKYCCLGVLCDLAVKAEVISVPIFSESNSPIVEGVYPYGAAAHLFILPYEVTIWADIKEGHGVFITENGRATLSQLNDRGMSFTDIADVIDRYF